MNINATDAATPTSKESLDDLTIFNARSRKTTRWLGPLNALSPEYHLSHWVAYQDQVFSALKQLVSDVPDVVEREEYHILLDGATKLNSFGDIIISAPRRGLAESRRLKHDARDLYTYVMLFSARMKRDEQMRMMVPPADPAAHPQ